MENGLVESAARIDEPEDRRIYGLTVAQVVKNCDETHAGRLQVRLPWLPDHEPWARLSLLDRGIYFIPQVGDEVLVASNRGDISELYVVGCLWNGKDKPPAQKDGDPVNKRVIRTPNGHDITFDDDAGTLTITSSSKKQITMSEDSIELAIDENASSAITVDKNGNLTIVASSKIRLVAPTIEIIGGSEQDPVPSGTCTIDGSRINIG
jgi:phage baseplate assembly protein V